GGGARQRSAAEEPGRPGGGGDPRTDSARSGGGVATAAPPSDAPGSAGASLDDPRVHEAMEEYLKLLQAGERPDRKAFLARYPDVAAVLVVCLQGLDFVHAAGPELSHPPTARPPPRLPLAAP